MLAWTQQSIHSQSYIFCRYSIYWAKQIHSPSEIQQISLQAQSYISYKLSAAAAAKSWISSCNVWFNYSSIWWNCSRTSLSSNSSSCLQQQLKIHNCSSSLMYKGLFSRGRGIFSSSWGCIFISSSWRCICNWWCICSWYCICSSNWWCKFRNRCIWRLNNTL